MTPEKRRLRRRLVALALATMTYMQADAQGTATASTDKISRAVLQDLRIGTKQRLLVTLNDDALRQDLQEKVNRKEASAEDRRSDYLKQKKIALDDIKNSLFPNGRRDRITVVDSLSDLPGILVDVVDIDNLLDLAADPKIKRIDRVPLIGPSGSNNLNLIGQPTTINAGKQGSGTRVAVLDGGLFNRNSSDLSGRISEAFEWNPDTGAQVPLCTYYMCSHDSIYGGGGGNASNQHG